MEEDVPYMEVVAPVEGVGEIRFSEPDVISLYIIIYDGLLTFITILCSFVLSFCGSFTILMGGLAVLNMVQRRGRQFSECSLEKLAVGGVSLLICIDYNFAPKPIFLIYFKNTILINEYERETSKID